MLYLLQQMYTDLNLIEIFNIEVIYQFFIFHFDFVLDTNLSCIKQSKNLCMRDILLLSSRITCFFCRYPSYRTSYLRFSGITMQLLFTTLDMLSV